MKIEFWLREPGNHHKAAEVDWSAVPREGEIVSLDGNNAWSVHSVMWFKQYGVARVYLERLKT